jgi:IS5 family transposase
MKPRQSPSKDKQQAFFGSELYDIIDVEHPLVILAHSVNWDYFEKEFGQFYCQNNGRPAHSIRLLVALQYLKYAFNFSDDATLAQWRENPYWQYFSGMKYFETTMIMDSSTMSRWRSRIQEAGCEALLAQTIENGLSLKAITHKQLETLNVDTTVQKTNIRYPTDDRLYDRARTVLVKFCKKHNIPLRRSYVHAGRKLYLSLCRLNHTKKFELAKQLRKKLKNMLKHVIQDIKKAVSEPCFALGRLLNVCQRILDQERNDKNKIYSVHEPQTVCVAKGKAGSPYEYGAKVALGTTSYGGWIVGCRALEGNPYDGHTLSGTLEQIVRITKKNPDSAFVDLGYRGHDYQGPAQIFISSTRKGTIVPKIWKLMKRRAAIEPTIGHLKREHRMERNQLHGAQGDKNNALLSAAGLNFWKMITYLRKSVSSLPYFFIFWFFAAFCLSFTWSFRHTLPTRRFFFIRTTSTQPRFFRRPLSGDFCSID